MVRAACIPCRPKRQSAARIEHCSPLTHEAKLADLLEHVRQGFAEYDAGRISAFELDDVVHHYTQAARELWKFCAVSGEQVARAAHTLEWLRQEGDEPDWWELPARILVRRDR